MSSIYDRRMVAGEPEAANVHGQRRRSRPPLRDNGGMPTPDQDLHEDRRRGDDRARWRPARRQGLAAGRDLWHGRRAQLADRGRARDRPVRAAGGRAAGHPEPAVRSRGGSRHAGHEPGAPSGPDRRAPAHREARAADRRAQRGRRAADQLPVAGRVAGRGPAPRRADGLPASRAEATSLARDEAIGPTVLPYLNRLSDALFVMARYENHERGVAEPLWEPGA